MLAVTIHKIDFNCYSFCSKETKFIIITDTCQIGSSTRDAYN